MVEPLHWENFVEKSKLKKSVILDMLNECVETREKRGLRQIYLEGLNDKHTWKAYFEPSRSDF